MAGVIPRKSSSGRKQWSLHGLQRNSLSRLRGQLASDGCPGSQVVLAKQLLYEECEFKSEERENAKTAVYWLMQASNQGNLEATDLLKMCLKTGKGIHEQNYMDVKLCLSITQDEKIVKRAAKELFSSLSNGEDYITSNQLQKKILAIELEEINHSGKSAAEQNRLENNDNNITSNYTESLLDSDEDDETADYWSLKSDYNNINNEKFTEDSLVSAAVTFSRGYLPEINRALCLSEPNLHALDDIPFVYRSILYPAFSLRIFYLKLMRYLGTGSIPLPLARSNLQLLLIFLIYSIVSFKNSSEFLPTVLFYLTLIVMIVSTFQLLQSQRELHDFRLWRGLFICYSNGELLNDEYSFETQFILNHVKQYVWFFLALFLHYFIYSLTPSNLKLESEFTVISFSLMFLTLIGFMPKKRSKTLIEPLPLLSFSINILAKYPYDRDPIVSKGWRYLELNFPSFPTYVLGNGIEFCINFQFLLYALIPIVLIQIARLEHWRGSYKVLLPHLITLSWLQYFALSSHNATMLGLFRATLALVGSVLFLPLVGITSILLPVLALTQWILVTFNNAIYAITLFFCLLAICFAVCFMCAKTQYAHYTGIFQIILMLLAFFALIKISDRSIISSSDSDVVVDSSEILLEWESFQKLCYQKVWEETENRAKAQVKCSELEGTRIFWEGTVNSVKLTKISNTMKSFLDKLPKFLRFDYFYCFIFGQKTTNNNCAQDDCLILPHTTTKGCSLSAFNIYTFEMNIKMSSVFWRIQPEVQLVLTDEFKNFTLRIHQKDSIWFKGILFNNNNNEGDYGILGSLKTHVRVEEIGCISCTDHELISSKKLSDNYNINNWIEKSELFWDKFYQCVKFLLNVFFNPILIFR